VLYGRGDGTDVVHSANDVNIAIAGYSRDDVTVVRRGGNAVVSFKGSDESLVLDLDGKASAKLTFADQGTLDISA
jgi:hypothetical protein